MSETIHSETDKVLDRNTLFPIFLKLQKLNLLIVGGGNVALEKLTAIFQNSPDAQVQLIANEINAEVRSFLSQHSIPFKERSFEPADLSDVDLVITAVNDKTASKLISEECNKRHILVNAADKPEYCDFYLSSVVQKGDLKIAISTNGKSPTIAKRVKEVLNESFPPEMNQVLKQMQEIRNTLSGDFADKVKQLNKITSVLSQKPKQAALKQSTLQIILYVLISLILMVLGHLLFSYFRL